MTSATDAYGETVILPEQVASDVAELAQRTWAHERTRLVAADGDAVVVMSEDDLDQTLQDAADLAEARDILAKPDAGPLTGEVALSWLAEVASGA